MHRKTGNRRQHSVSAFGFFALLALLVAGIPAAKADSAPGTTAESLPVNGLAIQTASPSSGTWIVNPGQPGPDLPPRGRSLFDYLVSSGDTEHPAYDIPFPFSALRDKIASQLQTGIHDVSPIKQVLIPLGRSLQRTAAAPDFFRYPRVVLTVDGEPASQAGQAGLLLRDRLYLGYLEKTGVIEVISYNEEAGRFEFQIVKNYRAGEKPRLVYANRSVCLACHQNATPIFSRPLWDETNANARIADRLREEQRDFYGIPVDIGVDVPNAIDDATDRANRIPPTQFLWRKACGTMPENLETRRCRCNALRFTLQYLFSGNLNFVHENNADWQAFNYAFTTSFRKQWPDGLLVSSPDIPNRAPLPRLEPVVVPGARPVRAEIREEEPKGIQQMHVAADLEPLQPRTPLAKWQADDSAKRFIVDLGHFFTAADLALIDNALFEKSSDNTVERIDYRASCNLGTSLRNTNNLRISFTCSQTPARSRHPRFSVAGRVYIGNGSVQRGSIDRLTFGEHTVLLDVDVPAGSIESTQESVTLKLRLSQNQRHARDSAGNALDSMMISWPHMNPDGVRKPAGEARGQVSVTVVKDFQRLLNGLAELAADTSNREDALSSRPFRRTAIVNGLLSSLDSPELVSCCAGIALPPAVTENGTETDSSPQTLLAQPQDPAEQILHLRCSACHLGSERFPPNFLSTDAERLRKNLRHCAERLYVRLHMWALPAGKRIKTPMPPAHSLAQLGLSADEWPYSEELASLQRFAHALLKNNDGLEPQLHELTARGYENLRECLPDEPPGDVPGSR